jgi:tetratricopeptide (TPR) repeat protein
MKYRTGKFLALLIGCMSLINSASGQSTDEWQQDIDLLLSKIEHYHPMPWARISEKHFEYRASEIKSNLKNWDNERIVLEIMKLVASLQDGHTQVLLDNQDYFDLWFPVRIEKFNDGLFITAVDTENYELLGSKVLEIGNYGSDATYQLLGEIIAKDSDYGNIRRLTNYISNAIILETLGIINSKTTLPLKVLCSNGSYKEVSLASSEWKLSFTWAYDKKSVPSNKEIVTIFEDSSKVLPLYLSGFLKSADPFWYEYLPADKMIYFQMNQVFDGYNESLSDFTEKILKIYDEKSSEIEYFVIDLRFNEGGNGDMVPALVQKFIQRNDSFERGKLFIITGNNTFSAASIFIGQMIKATNAITVGEIADGPLNFSSDPVMFILPHSHLLVNISRLYSQDGHPTDQRGYYPPDYYVPLTSKDYFSFTDPVLESIKKNEVRSLKDILYNEGTTQFKTTLEKREYPNDPGKKWFPYTSYDLALYVFNVLIPSEKYEESVEISMLNTLIYPESIWGWFILGMLYENMGVPAEAQNCFKRLLTIEPCHAEVKWEYEKINALLEPVHLEPSLLKNYTGEFEGRKIELEDGQLKYQAGEDKKRTLTPISENYFLIEDSSYRIVFEMNHNKAEKIKIIKWDGKTEIYKLTGS